MRFWNQVWLLMWKNFLIQRRQIWVPIIHVLLPVIVSLLISSLRHTFVLVKSPVVRFSSKEPIAPYTGSFSAEKIIGYVPVCNVTDDVMKHVLLLLMTDTYRWHETNISMKGFTSEAESFTYRNFSKNIAHVIVFHGVSSSSTLMPKRTSLSIRYHIPYNYFTESPFSFFRENWPMSDTVRDILCLQGVIGEALARYWTAKRGGNPDSIDFNIYSKRFPFFVKFTDKFTKNMRTFLHALIPLSFIPSVIIFTKNIAAEKEKKLKESLKLMGLTSTAYWISWYLTFSMYLLPIISLYTLMFTLPIVPSNGPVLNHSSGSLLFVLLLIYTHAMITFCFMISRFVTQANTGAYLSGIVFLLFFIPYLFVIRGFDEISQIMKLLNSLMFNTGMSWAINVLGAYDGSGEGVTWGNFYQRSEDDNSISLLDCMMMMLVGSIIHLLITWYMDNVRPGEFGVPKPYTFCFRKSYWLGAGDNVADSASFDLPQSKYFEKDPRESEAGIQMCNLRKVIRGRVAVAGTSLNMYKEQITVLLGHSRAGKTTTMAMITGSIPPTSGTAIVNGYDIRTNIDDVRNSLGLCLQHDVLFDKITVSEHFRFFSKIKGYSSPTLKEEVLEMATKVGLQDKLNTYSKNLSGGERRKLSVGIALIGGSQVVILDEPTSGLDSDSRHHIWSLLQEVRQGRTIMLITNSVYEAEHLGDRIAIMVGGVIKCCGSPLYLKKLYGVGHHLIVVIKPGCDIPTLTVAIQSIIPQATPETVVNTEVIYLLPDKESGKFATLSELLHSEKAHLQISSFGTTPPTMEEVFLKAGGSIQDNNLAARNVNKNMAGSTSADGDVFLTVTKKWEGDISKITETIRCFFPTAEPTNICTQTVTYTLPKNDSDKLSALCNELENSKDALKIINFSTLALSIISDIDSLPVDSSVTYISNGQTDSVICLDFNTGFSKKEGISLELSRFTGVFVKNALLAWHSAILMILLSLIPACLTFIAIDYSSNMNVIDQEERPRPISLNIVPYGETYILYTDGKVQSANSSAIADLYKRQFCSCHNTEYVRLQDGETFDNFTGRKFLKLSKSEYTRKLIIGMEVVHSSSPNNISAIAYYKSRPLYSEAISVNYLVNTLLQFALNSSFSLKTTISPLPSNKKYGEDNGKEKGLTFGILISFAVTCITMFFIVSLIDEKQTGAKHVQIMTGISPVTYWVAAFYWDFVKVLVPSLVIPILFELFQVRAYTEDGRWAVVVLVLALFCWAMISFLYMLQFLFTTGDYGVIIVMIIFSFLLGATTYFLHTFKSVDITVDTLLSCVFPSHNFASCLIYMHTNYEALKRCLPLLDACKFQSIDCCKETCGDNCLPYETDYLSIEIPGIGRYLIAMAFQGLIFFLAVMLIEYHVFQRVWYYIIGEGSRYVTSDQTTEDSDVAAERVRITTTPMSALTPTDPLVLTNLYKRYNNFTAVDHICVGITQGECFGLLGKKGAGKTTTFKMITGEIMLSGGNVYLNGCSVTANIKQVQANIGYCPQFNSLIDQLTGRETLTLYARLRGVPEESIGRVVDSLASSIKMTEYLDDYCGNYSDCNKRKLSTAIALIGDPPLLMLDEPTSGFDLEAKRNMWTVLSRIRASGRTIVLTSKSMEECEALCTRIAIMVNGRFMCLGSPQHLKNKFGQGYTLVMKLGTANTVRPNSSEPIIEVITSTFPGSEVFGNHDGYIQLHVPQDNVEIADIFDAMDKIKQEYNLQDYSVQKTTLEQVFLSFTNKQIISPAYKNERANSTGNNPTTKGNNTTTN